jgi:hypothetical protein
MEIDFEKFYRINSLYYKIEKIFVLNNEEIVLIKEINGSREIKFFKKTFIEHFKSQPMKIVDEIPFNEIF